MVLKYIGQNGLTAKGKVSIQRRSGVASGQCTGRAARGRGREQASEAEGKSVGMWRAIRGSAEACSQARRWCHMVDIARF